MSEKNATQQVLDLRSDVDRTKTRATEARTKKRVAEDQLVAADDAIEQLGLDPDRDLERQEQRLIEKAQTDLGQLEERLGEAESIFASS